MMQSYCQSEFYANSVSRIRPRLGGLPDLETFTWQNLTPAARVTRQTEQLALAGHPTYHVNVIKLNKNERLCGQAGYPTIASYLT